MCKLLSAEIVCIPERKLFSISVRPGSVSVLAAGGDRDGQQQRGAATFTGLFAVSHCVAVAAAVFIAVADVVAVVVLASIATVGDRFQTT